MSIQELKKIIPDYGKDIRLNLTSVFTVEGAPGLNKKQILGTALASAYATKNQELSQYVFNEAKETLDDNEINAAKSASVIMAMNNIYYRFTHLVSDKSYSTLPAKLRMNVIANPGVEKIDFELYSLAISAINGCGLCIDAHVQTLRKDNVSETGIQSCIRIASVINAAAQTLFLKEA